MQRFVFCSALVAVLGVGRCIVMEHHSNYELGNILQDIQRRCQDISYLYSLQERSVNGQPLWVMAFSEKDPQQHIPGRPEFKYVANIHGNEVVGRELLTMLADFFCNAYHSGNEYVRKLLKLTRLHLMPSMNPDGYDRATEEGSGDYYIGRTNANNVDLNRNFPDLDRVVFTKEALGDDNSFIEQLLRLATSHERQPETRAVIEWMSKIPFVLSASLHGGDLVANYPYDESRSGDRSEYSATPDDDVFRDLARTYAENHPKMADPKRKICPMKRKNFGEQGGITNGAEWYSLKGGMQDYAYLKEDTMEITVELGCEKYPPAEALAEIWKDNLYPLLAFIWKVHMGIKGQVFDTVTGKPITDANIRVVNVTDRALHIDHDVTSGDEGHYYRLLTPGVYDVTAYARGFNPSTKRVGVPKFTGEEALHVNFGLDPTATKDLPPVVHQKNSKIEPNFLEQLTNMAAAMGEQLQTVWAGRR